MENNSQIVKSAGFIGDVHAEDILFETSITFFKNKGIKDIYCLGDFCDGTGNVNRIISIVNYEGIIAVQGNHDIWCLEGVMRNLPNSSSMSNLSSETIDIIKGLPKTYRLMTAAGEVIICHGILDNEMAKVNPDDYGYSIESNIDLQTYINGLYPSILINGHSHRRMVKQILDKTIINVGTLCKEHNPSIAIIDFVNRNVYFHDIIYGVVISEPDVVCIKLI